MALLSCRKFARWQHSAMGARAEVCYIRRHLSCFLAPLPLLPVELIQCVSKIPRRYDIYDITSPTRNIFSTNWPYILNFQLTIVKKFLN